LSILLILAINFVRSFSSSLLNSHFGKGFVFVATGLRIAVGTAISVGAKVEIGGKFSFDVGVFVAIG